jgi:hypothetical protein
MVAHGAVVTRRARLLGVRGTAGLLGVRAAAGLLGVRAAAGLLGVRAAVLRSPRCALVATGQ